MKLARAWGNRQGLKLGLQSLLSLARSELNCNINSIQCFLLQVLAWASTVPGKSSEGTGRPILQEPGAFFQLASFSASGLDFYMWQINTHTHTHLIIPDAVGHRMDL